jgi:hypothetical protein
MATVEFGDANAGFRGEWTYSTKWQSIEDHPQKRPSGAVVECMRFRIERRQRACRMTELASSCVRFANIRDVRSYAAG